MLVGGTARVTSLIESIPSRVLAAQ